MLCVYCCRRLQSVFELSSEKEGFMSLAVHYYVTLYYLSSLIKHNETLLNLTLEIAPLPIDCFVSRLLRYFSKFTDKIFPSFLEYTY